MCWRTFSFDQNENNNNNKIIESKKIEEFDNLHEVLAKQCHEMWCNWFFEFIEKSIGYCGSTIHFKQKDFDKWMKMRITKYSDLDYNDQELLKQDAQNFLDIIHEWYEPFIKEQYDKIKNK